MKKKLILVSFVGGRCGSSMVMGCLARAGVNVGPQAAAVKSVENPGGFYEIKQVQDYFQKYYYDHNGPFKPRWSFDKLRAMKSVRPELLNIFKHVYGDAYPLAIKTMDFVSVATFENDPEFDVRVVCVKRDIEDQARSISRMWSKKEYPAKRFYNCLMKRYEWMEEFKNEFDFPYLDMDFDKILDYPVRESKKLLKFCDLKVLDVNNIKKWINKKYSRSRNG